jgi:hypothetical protein
MLASHLLLGIPNGHFPEGVSTNILYAFLFMFAISLLHRVQTGSVAHPASYKMGTRDSFPRGKAARA